MKFSRRCSSRWRVVQVGGVAVGSVHGFSFVRHGLSAGQKERLGGFIRIAITLLLFVAMAVVAVSVIQPTIEFGQKQRAAVQGISSQATAILNR